VAAAAVLAAVGVVPLIKASLTSTSLIVVQQLRRRAGMTGGKGTPSTQHKQSRRQTMAETTAASLVYDMPGLSSQSMALEGTPKTDTMTCPHQTEAAGGVKVQADMQLSPWQLQRRARWRLEVVIITRYQSTTSINSITANSSNLTRAISHH
jgi:hypothetical protein